MKLNCHREIVQLLVLFENILNLILYNCLERKCETEEACSMTKLLLWLKFVFDHVVSLPSFALSMRLVAVTVSCVLLSRQKLELYEELSAIFSEANNLQTWREILSKVNIKCCCFQPPDVVGWERTAGWQRYLLKLSQCDALVLDIPQFFFRTTPVFISE